MLKLRTHLFWTHLDFLYIIHKGNCGQFFIYTLKLKDISVKINLRLGGFSLTAGGIPPSGAPENNQIVGISNIYFVKISNQKCTIFLQKRYRLILNLHHRILTTNSVSAGADITRKILSQTTPDYYLSYSFR